MKLPGMLHNFHPLRRLMQGLWDLIATAFYLLAARFMRRFPRLARPVVYYTLYAYFLLRDGYREHRRTLKRCTVIALHLFSALLTPLFMLYLSEAITLQSFPAAQEWIIAHGEASALTVLFLGGLATLSYAVFRSYLPGTLVGAVVLAAFTLVNHYKMLLNGFPLMLSDFTFLSGAEDILAYAMPEISVTPHIKLCLFLFLATVALSFFISRALPKDSRVSFLLLSLSLPLLLSLFGPGAIAAQASALTEECTAQEERLRECGVLGGLYSTYVNSKNADNSAYHSDNVSRLSTMLYLEAAQQAAAHGESAVRPHILIVLAESFFDATRYESLVFDRDPLPVFHALSQEYTNGRFLSSTYAGGTGYVELEMLTGINNYSLNDTDTLCSLSKNGDSDIYEQFPSLARDLSEGNGYETYYIHSHTSTLYDRAHIMDALGFDHVIFDEDFSTDAEHDGFYISDKALVNEVIHRFEEREDGSPVFMQITSMENHRPYTAEKYTEERPVQLSCDLLDEKAIDELSSFVHGLTHEDEALGQLVDYFEDCGEPVMIVFYGDHLPTMQTGSTALLYESLGIVASADTTDWSAEELKEMLSTDYLIWTNYEETPADDQEESSLFLGANALHRAGVMTSPFLHWLSDDAAQKYLASRPRLFVSGDGTPQANATEEASSALNDHELMVYDLLYGEQLLKNYFHVERGTPLTGVS